MSRMNNAKEDRKKRNVTFHGLPEVQEETTPRDGFYDQPKKNLLEVKDDDGAEFQRQRSSTMIADKSRSESVSQNMSAIREEYSEEGKTLNIRS